MARGSVAVAKSGEELGQLCLQPLNREKVIYSVAFVKILAVGYFKRWHFDKVSEWNQAVT